jgi:hypothetical protein
MRAQELEVEAQSQQVHENSAYAGGLSCSNDLQMQNAREEVLPRTVLSSAKDARLGTRVRCCHDCMMWRSHERLLPLLALELYLTRHLCSGLDAGRRGKFGDATSTC